MNESVTDVVAAVKSRLGSKRRDMAEIEEAGQRAGSLASELNGLRADLVRLEKRHAAFAALGKKPFEVRNPLSTAAVGPAGALVEFEPYRSVKTGAELATETQAQMEHIRAEIAQREAEIERFLA